MTKLSKYLFIVLSAVTVGLLVAVGVMAFTGPGSNQPPTGDPTASLGEVPSGAVMFFNLGACPSGWTEYTLARGRVIVGTPLDGTNASTTGTALTNLGTRTITDVPSHLHAVDPPATLSDTTGAHTHNTSVPSQYAAGTLMVSNGVKGADVNRTSNSIGNHAHTVDITAFNSGSTGMASVDVTMPYIQLRACSKD